MMPPVAGGPEAEEQISGGAAVVATRHDHDEDIFMPRSAEPDTLANSGQWVPRHDVGRRLPAVTGRMADPAMWTAWAEAVTVLDTLDDDCRTLQQTERVSRWPSAELDATNAAGIECAPGSISRGRVRR